MLFLFLPLPGAWVHPILVFLCYIKSVRAKFSWSINELGITHWRERAHCPLDRWCSASSRLETEVWRQCRFGERDWSFIAGFCEFHFIMHPFHLVLTEVRFWRGFLSCNTKTHVKVCVEDISFYFLKFLAIPSVSSSSKEPASSAY